MTLEEKRFIAACAVILGISSRGVDKRYAEELAENAVVVADELLAKLAQTETARSVQCDHEFVGGSYTPIHICSKCGFKIPFLRDEDDE